MKYSKKLLYLLVILFVIISNINPTLAKPIAKNLIPKSPTNLSATNITSSDITLSWSSVSGTLGYKIYKASPNDSNYSLVATVSSIQYKDTALNAGTNYWYFVRSYNSSGMSNDSIHIKAVTNEISPSSKTVLGYSTYYYAGDKSSYNSMTLNSSIIDEIATDTFKTDGSGNISGLIPTEQITYANNNGITTFAMVTNNFDGNIAKNLLENPTNRKNLINNILLELNANGYKGVNIDLEGVFYYDRSYYTIFMSELYNTLNPLGYIVTAAVPAKTSDSPNNTWSGAYDYAQLANYADKIVLMTYDEHYPGGTSGPIASIGWVENVIKYSVSVIPKEKIILGTAAYGYDWSSNGTKAYGISNIYNLASNNNASILWDSVSKSPYFNYTDSNGLNHSVWFENSESINYKLDLVNSYNLSGIAIWRLGLENFDYWISIKNKLNK